LTPPFFLGKPLARFGVGGFFFYIFFIPLLSLDNWGVLFYHKIKNEVSKLSVGLFIKKDETLSQLHYLTVYQTITTLIARGILSLDDLK
jgi:hypothetical protein